jgi:hypothetical protein
VVPAIGGVFLLVGDGRSAYRLRCAGPVLLGLQCKTGCVDAQLEEAAAPGKKAKSTNTVPMEIHAETSENISYEAAVLRAARRRSKQLLPPGEERAGADAEALLRICNTAAIRAFALETLLFVCKYNCFSPTYRSSMSTLYALHNSRAGERTWHEERGAASLVDGAPYMDILPIGSTKHDSIKALQQALKFNDAMDMVAWNMGTRRSVAAVFSRLLRLLPTSATLYLDAASDYYETLLAIAAGWLEWKAETPPSAAALQQIWLQGVFPTDKVGLIQLLRTNEGHDVKATSAGENRKWQNCILAGLFARVVPVAGRVAPMKLIHVGELPRKNRMAALESKVRMEDWWGEVPLAYRVPTCKCKWRAAVNSGGHLVAGMQLAAQQAEPGEHAAVGKKMAVEKTFGMLLASEELPVDLLGDDEMQSHNIICLQEHSDKAALWRLACLHSRGKLRSVTPNLSAPYEMRMRCRHERERLVTYQRSAGTAPPSVESKRTAKDTAATAAAAASVQTDAGTDAKEGAAAATTATAAPPPAVPAGSSSSSQAREPTPTKEHRKRRRTVRTRAQQRSESSDSEDSWIDDGPQNSPEGSDFGSSGTNEEQI